MTTAPVPAGYQPSPWRAGSPPSQRPPLAGDVRVDYAVVGAGLAGLAAAYHLHRNEPDATIIVLEANMVGSGATGASTGIVAPGVGGPITLLRRRYGDQVAAATFAGSVTAVARTVELVGRENLDCDLELNGQLVCAVSRRQDRALRAQHRSFAELGFDIPYLPAQDLADRFGGRPYLAALRHPLAATLDPAKLCRSLADRLMTLGVRIHERSPVLSVRPGVPVAVRCPSGTVLARQVVMATDGVQPKGLPSAGVVPITGYVIRTDPLTDRQLDRIGWLDRDSVVDCRTFFNYYRLTPDNRIIMGGGRVTLPPGGVASSSGRDTAWGRIELELRTIFPELAEVGVSDRWSGRIGSVLDRLPRLGRLPSAPGVWFTGGWCGHGIPLSVQAGFEIAQRITGVGSEPDVAWYREKVPALPGGPQRDWGLLAYLAGLDHRDRVLDRFGRVGHEFASPRPVGDDPMRPQEFDVIVVGAGSAGCAIAARLAADESRTVLLLEAGGRGRRPETVVPALYSRLFRSSMDWAYRTEPQAELNGRRPFWPRGRALGGSSAINDMVYVRGNSADFDGWAAQGNEGWDHAGMVPHFRAAEAALWGTGGPVEENRWLAPRTADFLAAAGRVGLTHNDGFNGDTQEGVGRHQVAQLRGRRVSAADAYLRPARANLTVVTGARVTGLVYAGLRVVGVRWVRHGRAEHARATSEVVLSGGAINSPTLLMASGIGDANALRRLGIDVRVDLPGVGRNLQDHLMFPLSWRSVEPTSLLDGRRPGPIFDYLRHRRGPLGSNLGQAGAFVRSRSGLDAPDVQLVFAPVLLDGIRDERVVEPTEHGYSIGAVLLQPGSRGRISLRSADPLARPLIDPGYLTDPADLATLLRGVRLALRIGGTAPLAGAARAPHRLAEAGDDQLIRAIRAGVDTMFHPVGTCRMGSDELAVVDPTLAVHGVEGLRVADASVMPTITRGNTHAPVTAIAERAAELILRGTTAAQAAGAR